MSGIEIAGLATAAPGIAHLFIKLAFEGYQLFKDIKLVGRDHLDLQFDFDVQRQRYSDWVERLSNHGGDLAVVIDSQSLRYELVLTCLARIAGMFVEVDRLKRQYGITWAHFQDVDADGEKCQNEEKRHRHYRKYLNLGRSIFHRSQKSESRGSKDVRSLRKRNADKETDCSSIFKTALVLGPFGLPVERERTPFVSRKDTAVDDSESNLSLATCATLREDELDSKVPEIDKRLEQLQNMAEAYQRSLPMYRKLQWKFESKKHMESLIKDLARKIDDLFDLTKNQLRENSYMEVPTMLLNGKPLGTPSDFREFEVHIPTRFQPLDSFCGRQDILDKIAETFRQKEDEEYLQTPPALGPETNSRSSRKVILLHGMGGLGKSAIVSQYAYRYDKKYSTILWIDATNQGSIKDSCVQILSAIIAHYCNKYTVTPRDIFARVAIDLKIPGQIDHNGQLTGDAQESPWNVIRNWLTEENNSQWLLIADGLNGENDSKNLKDVLPTAPHGHIIITSRVCMLKGLDDIAKDPNLAIVEVPILDKQSGVQYLLGRTFDSAVQAVKTAAEKIVDLLGNLPLALAHAVAYIKTKKIDIFIYLERLERDLVNFIGEADDDYEKGVFSGWRLTVKELEQNHPDCVPLLRILSFLSPHGVSKALLTRGIEGMDWLHDEDYDEVDRLNRLDRAVDFLVQYGLVGRIPGVSTKGERTTSFWIHNLVQGWARNNIKNGKLTDVNVDKGSRIRRRQLYELHQKGARDAIRLVGCGVVDIDSNPEQREWVYERENWAHLKLCCEEYIPKYKFENQGVNDGKLGRAMRKLGDWKSRWQEHHAALALAEKAIKVLESTVRVDDSWEHELLLAKQDVAELYARGPAKAPDGHDADKYITEISKRQEELLGANHPRTLFNGTILGLHFARNEKWAEARNMLLDVLKRMKAAVTIEDDDIVYIVTIRTLAFVYVGLCDYAEALGMYTESYKLYLRKKGRTWHSIGILQDMGFCKLTLGDDRDGGLEYLENAVEVAEGTYGLAHPETVDALLYLRQSYLEDEREEVAARADRIYEKLKEAKELGAVVDDLQ
ncbi:hypothetical protein TWF481_001109 [Arthrobotrys musiformis]|uniref:Prion-inhibition and propagation HeLo domain-containing protein n=1 Tax=Arthrobotrys musiformis TaxID=47236 RepID=A0AAV9WR99_9PEZI